MTRYLEVDDLMQVLERMGGRGSAVRDAGLLVSALARPQARLAGVDVYPSLALKAAAFLTSLATAEALHSNNARAAWVATRLFCAANGAPLCVTADESVATIEEIVSSGLDLEELGMRLARWMTPAVEDPVKAAHKSRG